MLEGEEPRKEGHLLRKKVYHFIKYLCIIPSVISTSSPSFEHLFAIFATKIFNLPPKMIKKVQIHNSPITRFWEKPESQGGWKQDKDAQGGPTAPLPVLMEWSRQVRPDGDEEPCGLGSKIDHAAPSLTQPCFLTSHISNSSWGSWKGVRGLL